jgi:hypothetical protein
VKCNRKECSSPSCRRKNALKEDECCRQCHNHHRKRLSAANARKYSWRDGVLAPTQDWRTKQGGYLLIRERMLERGEYMEWVCEREKEREREIKRDLCANIDDADWWESSVTLITIHPDGCFDFTNLTRRSQRSDSDLFFYVVMLCIIHYVVILSVWGPRAGRGCAIFV